MTRWMEWRKEESKGNFNIVQRRDGMTGNERRNGSKERKKLGSEVNEEKKKWKKKREKTA